MSSRIPISKSLILRNSASSLVRRGLEISVLLWLQQYLLKRISPDEYALYPVILSIMAFVFMIRSVFSSGMARFITSAFAREDDAEVTTLTSTMFILHLAAALVVLVPGLAFAAHVETVLTVAPPFVHDARLMMAILIAGFALKLAMTPFTEGLVVRQRFVLQDMVGLLTTALRILFLFVLLFGVSTRVLWVVVASESATLIGVTILTCLSLRAIPAMKFDPRRVSARPIRRLLSFGAWNSVGQVAQRLYTNMDPIILNKFAGALDVTCFHLGSLVAKHIAAVRIAATNPVVPVLTALHATDQNERLTRVYLRFGRISIWTYLLMTLPFIIFSHELVGLYVGDEFRVAATVMPLLLIAHMPGLGNSMLYKLAIARGSMREISLRSICAQVVNLCLTFLFVGCMRLGAIGSSLASFLVLSTLMPVLHVPLGLRLANVDFRTWLYRTNLPGFLPGVVTAAFWVGLRQWHAPDSWWLLALYATAGYAVFLSVMLGLCLQEEDRRDLSTVVAQVRHHVNAMLHPSDTDSAPEDPAI